MKSSLRHLARAFVEVCSSLNEKEYGQACAAALQFLGERGGTAADRRQFVRSVVKELRAAGAAETVTLATPTGASGEHAKKIAHALEKALSKKIELEEHADKELIGGARISVGDDRYDASVRGALERCQLHLTTA